MKIQLLCLFSFLRLFSSDVIEFTSIQAPGTERLFHQDGEFIVQKLGRSMTVPAYFVDENLRNQTIATLQIMQEKGYIKLNKLDANYRLEYFPRGKGGGYLAGLMAYGAVHLFGWGMVSGAANACVNQVVHQHAPAMGANSAIGGIGSHMADAVDHGYSTFAGGAIGAAGGHVGGTQTGQEVAVAGVAVAAAQGMGIGTGIEAAARAAQAFFTAIPWLP